MSQPLPGYSESSGPLSNRRILFCIGAQRGGTSWLHTNIIKPHARLHQPAVKEIHYWDVVRPPHLKAFKHRAKKKYERQQDSLRSGRSETYSSNPARHKAIARFTEARALLYSEADPRHIRYSELLLDASRPEQILVDNTPAYALLDSAAYAEMDALGDARFLFVMRDPVSRLWSGIRKSMRRRLENGEVTPEQVLARFEEALGAQDDLDLARSDYKRTIQNLEASVAANRILYVFHESMFDQSACDRVTDFLGIVPVKVHPEEPRNRGVELPLEPDARLRAQARERLAPTYDFVRGRFGPDVPARWMN